jgi:hypothetical protein
MVKILKFVKQKSLIVEVVKNKKGNQIGSLFLFTIKIYIILILLSQMF